MNKLSIKKWIGLGFIAFVTAALAFFFLEKKPTTKPPNFAENAATRLCGESPKSAVKEQDLFKRYVDEKSLGASPAALRAIGANLQALPPYIFTELTRRGTKIGVINAPSNTSQCPNLDAGQNRSSERKRRRACFMGLGSSMEVLMLTPDSKSFDRPASDRDWERGIHSSFLPTFAWLTFEKIWTPPPSFTVPRDDQMDRANVLSILKQKLSSLLVTSIDDQQLFQEDFSGSGLQSPSYWTRNLVLLTTNVYCSKPTHDRLSMTQPRAMELFSKTFLCVLGKPWHMGAVEYNTRCRDASVKSGGFSP
ncbi:MAG: hypothetical protein NTV34_13805 [Proteobacteria bacterium]|nr:hypothetical protein [Pseudomonadota bacterium]